MLQPLLYHHNDILYYVYNYSFASESLLLKIANPWTGFLLLVIPFSAAFNR